jgi:predicted O-methyltransferase YrrM
VIDKLSPHGLIAADNTLYHGALLEAPAEEDHSARALSDFNEMLAKDENLAVVMLTVRDGLTLIRRR